MKIVIISIGSLVLIMNTVLLSIKADCLTNYDHQVITIRVSDDEEGFDCWSKTIYEPGARILECNYPCCYRNDWRDYDFEPHGKCTVIKDPESQTILSEIGFGECNDE